MTSIATTLDDPPENHTDYEAQMLSQIREFGWRTTHVASDTSTEPCFTYSTGFWKTLGQPEVIVFDFPPALAHDVIGQMFNKLKQGEKFSQNEPISGILGGENVYLLEVANDAVAEYLRSSVWFYKGHAVASLQIIWPDRSGIFPWHPDFDPTLKGLQTDISKIGWPQ